MKYTPHNRYTLPDALRITPDGRIILKDGGDVSEYLKGWFDANRLTETTPVNLFTTKEAEYLILPHCA